MTLDEFLRTLETLVDDQVADDDPGEGNFGCQNCRACYSCRFCIGCDSCEDCTYCEESLECISCTQSKRCVSCEKVSYCEDCRDCKASRYLTLCVDCTDCIHCLGCVGLKGAEFYVLNQKRSRKEYFTLLRQVQELLRVRYDVGWRPPTIGLSSDVSDPALAGRDVELSTAPWLDDLFAEPDPELEVDRGWERERGHPAERDLDAFAAELEVDPELALPARSRPAAREREREGKPSRPPVAEDAPLHREQAETRPMVRSRNVERARSPYEDSDPVRSHAWEDSRENTVARQRPSPPASGRPHDPRGTDPGSGRVSRWDDDDQLVDDGDGEYEYGRDGVPDPVQRDREPSSPWLDEGAKNQPAARSSLRRAGRPTRKPEGGPMPESGTGTYRTGKVPKRGDFGTDPRDESTKTGLRTGRRPKREG
jgi:hypothetical protein